MGVGWVLLNPSPQFSNFEFSTSTAGSPSSTKAEVVSLLSALLVCPESSSVSIFTDSQATIDGFHLYVDFNLFLTDRRRLKH